MPQRLWSRTGWLTVFWGLAAITLLPAQSLPQYSSQQRSQQRELQRTIEQVQTENYRQAVAQAQRLNRPINQLSPSGRVVKLRGINSRGELLYDATYSTTKAAISTHTNSLYAGGSLGVALSGSTLKDKLGVWDGGKVRDTHVEFRNGTSGSRVVQVDNATTLVSHSTHVAGILMAAGVNPLVKGMAFGTNLRAYDFSRDVSEMSAAAPNLLISNHSYGSNAGWVYDDTRTTTTKWEWWGDTTISKTEDYKFGIYDDAAASWDKIAQNAPYYLIVKAAGNDHGSDGPGAGQPYYLGTSNVISTLPRNNQDGYGQASTYSTAKNILTVAAVGNLNFGYNQPSDIPLSDFTSWGPTDDGRIKPDISGIGVGILSSSSENDSAYVVYDGTSMASPNVAGSLLLLQELYSQRNSGKYLRSSTLKGLALHTADEGGTTPGPDYQFGWGLLNAETAGRVILNTNQNYLLDERTLNQAETYSLTVVASGRGPLVSTICWTDPVGTASVPTSATVNDRTPKLINDLDARISDGKATTLPWILDPNNPSAAATRGDNVRDNIEQVLIANPVPGKSYTITVANKGTLSGGKQDYALLVSGIGGKAYCASGATSTADSKISRVQFGSINQAGPDGCTSYTDFSQTTTTVQAGQQIPLTVSLGTCGATKNVIVKAFADWNQNGSFDDAGETLATSGVLANSAQFATTVTVPASVSVSQFVRLRIVATETDNAATVLACGAYGNGETQDYVLNVIQTSNDVGATALISPEANFCGQTGSDISVAVRVHNYGAVTQTNVPVSVTITNAANVAVTTLSGTVPQLSAFRESVLTLKIPSSVILAAGQTYRFTVSTGLGNDQNAANNTVTETRVTAPAPTNGLFTVTRCGSDTTISLRNIGGGTAFWYDAPTGGNLLAAGNQLAVKSVPASGQFYATLNDFSGAIGPVDKNAFGGGSYGTGFQPAPLITTQVPLLIESARLYIGSAGTLTFTVRKYDNTAVSSVTLDVTPTRTQSLTAITGGTYPDDPDDQGAVYALNLRIPAAGDYKITIDYGDGASIFRSNTAVSGFPYQLKTQTNQPIVTIKGSLFNNGTTTDTLKTAWYYFYNMRVRSLDCPSPQRTAVTPAAGTGTTATITPNGSTSVCQGASVLLAANTGTNLSYQWYRDGQVITGSTSSTILAATAGSYVVQVANNCLPVKSAAVALTVKTAQTPVIVANGFILTSNVTTNIQWLVDGVPIPGATSPSYTVAKSGRYSVKGSVNGCGESISDEVFLTILATEPIIDDSNLSVYPNPATRQVTVSLAATLALPKPPAVRLTNLSGQTVRTATLQRDGKSYSTIFDVADLPGGTFFVVVEDDQSQSIRVKRIRKQ
ncbi:S8 family serine peptidase [Spirosoma flavum]|uniref:S8 family serine peptidase n=1 Tax=Spirosoma flavum TaxID=2048557 RepID=A0ABW6AQB6_9BACT